ncbi:antibiotic biosynthesis monooxygenase family protein [Muricoccus radiodurans]|uniref:antibiotic biosynthesis monooxygenase family protein n=1 Tax=Muricoccus radiodurans TaxID=2231721 RepID=UPI003CEB4341
MIVRAWRGRARPGEAGAYPDHFRRRVMPELRGVPGFLGASLLRDDSPDGAAFLVLTRWASMEAVRGFAGDAPDRAVVESGAVAALASFDETVVHYEMVEEVPA